jgi:hypothetical protein
MQSLLTLLKLAYDSRAISHGGVGSHSQAMSFLQASVFSERALAVLQSSRMSPALKVEFSQLYSSIYMSLS